MPSTTTLITGVPGWLGNRFIEVLHDQPSEFHSWNAYPERSLRCFVLPGMDSSFLKHKGCDIALGNIAKLDDLQSAMRGVDTVFHLAGIIHPSRVKDFYLVNTEGTRNVLTAAEQAHVKRVVVISSNSVAGCNLTRNRLMEESDSPRPYKHYGRSKFEAERVAHEFMRRGHISLVLLRPCWFYGPGQPARQTRFFKMIKKGTPLLFGDGQNLRSMSYLDNVIQGLLLAESSERAHGQTYWIADEGSYSTIQIYSVIADLLGVPLHPTRIPGITSWVCERVDDVLQAFGLYSIDFHVAGEMVKDIACSIEKAKLELGYKPTVDLREGMRRSIEWCRSNGVEI